MASVFDGVPQVQGINLQPALSAFNEGMDQRQRLSQISQQMDLQRQAAQEQRSEKAMMQIANVAHGDPANYTTGIKAVADQFPDLAPQLMGLADPSKQGAVRDRTTTYAERIAQSQAAAEQAYRNASLDVQRQGLGIQQQNADKPQVEKITNIDGSESIVRVPQKGAAEVVTGGAGTGTNPYATGKMTPEQGKVATFVDRMAAADKILQNPDIANVNKGFGGAIGGAIENTLPAGIVAPLAGADRRQSMQAKQDFLNAVLRRESGAAISSGEFATGNLQYFPQPNDDSKTLAQKAENRRREIEGFMREAGPTYKPPQGYVGVGSGPAPPTATGTPAAVAGGPAIGGVTPANATPAPTKGGGKAFDASTVADVQKAVAAGVPRDAIIKRLQDNGYDTSQLGQ